MLGCKKILGSLDISTIRLYHHCTQLVLVASLVVFVQSYLVVQKPIGDEQQVLIKLYYVSLLDQGVEMYCSYGQTAEKTFPHIHNSVIIRIHHEMHIECLR